MAEYYPCTKRERRSLECSICLGRFRNPKTLPCLHSYCEDCLITYALDGTTTIKCPQCKEEMEVPDGDARNFKSNFHLKELTEEAAFREELGQPSTKLLCNCCDGEDSEAMSRCLDCNQYLCSSGVAAHQRFAALRQHVIASLDDIRSGKVKPKTSPKQKMMCQKHPHKEAEIFCTTCEVPICHVCATLKHKSPDHECIEVTDATEERKQLALKGLQQLEAVKSRFQEASERMESERQLLLTRTSDLKETIEKKFDVLHHKVEREKKKLQKEVDDIFTADVNKLDGCQTETKESISRMSSIQEQAKIMVEGAGSANFLSMYDILKTKIDQLCTEKPQEYRLTSSSMNTLSVMVSNSPSLLVGSIAASVKKGLTLVGEYNPNEPTCTTQGVVTEGSLQPIPSPKKVDHDLYGITAFSDNGLAVTDRKTNEVVILDSNMKYVTSYKETEDKTGLKHPCGVAGLFDSKLAVVDSSRVVHLYDTNGDISKIPIKGEEDAIPLCIAPYLYKHFIVGSHGKLNLFEKSCKYDNCWEERGSPHSIKPVPTFLATHKQQILVSDSSAKCVTCFRLEKSLLGFTTIITPVFSTRCLGECRGICVDRAGYIYIATNDSDCHCIYQYTSSGHLIGCLERLEHPINGMIFREDGKLAVACGESVKLYESCLCI